MTEPDDPSQDSVGDPEARASSKHLTRWVAQTLRGQIMSGELSPGDKLPSQNALEGRFNVSTVTVRNAVEELEDEGLIAKRQGAHTQVHNREPTHRLVINLLRPAHDGQPAAELPGGAETPVSFAAREHRRGRLRRESAVRQVPAARHIASLLGLRDGDPVVARTFTLFYDDEPVLMSTSYLPPTLATLTAPDSDTAMPNVQVGQLALDGHSMTSVALRLRTRMPDPAEFDKLAMVKGTPVQVLTHSVVVQQGQREEPVRAAVEVVSRGDRVYVEIELDGR